MIRQHIISRITEFCAATDISERRLGLATVHDPNFVPRLRRGYSTQLGTLEKVENYMAAEVARRGVQAPTGLI